ncbi:hypothetical protein J3Q64DRAFT_1765385 [Phycomyces blakesleeanus]|uniref:UBX domain-containing protein 2 n=1 Tax=Phycomyces blakesleeanus TaxID=4837 RepID=A0ABR3ANE3_PHYBL
MSSIANNIWFEGPIGEAVSKVNDRNCLLFVYIYDDSPQSDQLSATLEDSNVSAQLTEHTVALKLEKDSDNAKLFTQLYPTYHIPIVYFIKQGIIKDFGTEDITPDAIITKLDTLSKLALATPTPNATPTTPTPTSASATAPSAVPSVVPSTAPLAVPSVARSVNPAEDAQKQEKIKRKLEEARKKREEREKREAHERELKRREDGKANQETKESLEDKQNKAYFDKLRKEKKEEEEHRKRVKEQIARDRAEKAASRQVAKPSNPVETSEPKQKSRQNSDQSKLSIRQLDGSTLRNTFQATDKLSNVQNWIDQNRSDGDQPYKLLAQFPTRQFSIGDEERSLTELDLCPSGTIIMKAIKNVSHAYAPSTVGGGLMDYVYSATGTLYQAAGTVGTTLSSALGSLFPAEPGNIGGYTNSHQQGGGGQRLGGPSASTNHSTVKYSHTSLSIKQRNSPSNVNTLRSTDSTNRETYNGNSVNQE